MNFKEQSVMFLATGFWVGNIPFAPGTFGSLIGLPLCFFLSRIELPLAMVLAVLFIIFSIGIAHAAEKIIRSKDPGCIVVDEIAGMLVALIGLPFNPLTVAIGFVVFRILDILKPFPIRALDKGISGGVGVVADDVVAGIFANCLLRLFLYLL
jgi:phosphatidylglycerophosphatase A